jgi:hypothetical protein
MTKKENRDLSVFISRLIAIGLISLALQPNNILELLAIKISLLFLAAYYLRFSLAQTKKLNSLHNTLLVLLSLTLFFSTRFSIILCITLTFIPSVFYLLHSKLFE